MTDLATESFNFPISPTKPVNHVRFKIMQVPFIPQEIKLKLQTATEEFIAKSYKKSANYFKAALDFMSATSEKIQDETIILTKYMLCICWLESMDCKQLLDALKILEDLVRNFNYEFPMLYYAVGKAYFKLYRFAKTDEIVKKGFAHLNGGAQVFEYKIPGTDVVIPESSKDRLAAALVSLNDQCSSWHRPDAVCCMPDCSNYSHNESADKNIFFGSPTFSGMVQVSCNNTSRVCTVSFHGACWKAKKESLCTLGKLSDKDLLHRDCFTPNCENQGVRCTIKKIVILDETARIKATIEGPPDDVIRHRKAQTPTPKGAIRKHQQQHQPAQPKVKVPMNEPRIPVERSSRPSNVPHDAHKLDEPDEDNEFFDEQVLEWGIEQLVEFRANNFGIGDEKIWRPDLPMYGNQFMLATADLMPDPDFSDQGPEQAELQAFFFSYFYTFISKSGPVRLDALAEKWDEAKHMIDNCESILKHYLDITEFLLQSVKFAVVGEYICVAEKLPEAYNLAKADTCETLRFFLENDIDQRSNSSSVDDEAFFNDIVNEEKNNNSLPYSATTIAEHSKTGKESSKIILDDPVIKTSRDKTTESVVSKVGLPLLYTRPNRSENKLADLGNAAGVNGHCAAGSSSNSVLVVGLAPAKVAPIVKNAEKVSNWLECEKNLATDTEPIAANGAASGAVNETAIKIDVAAAAAACKSANNCINENSPTNKRAAVINASGKTIRRPSETMTPPPQLVRENGAANSASARNQESLVQHLIEEVQRLGDREAQLKSQVEQMKKAHAAERLQLLRKILQGQYDYTESLIQRHLEESRKNYQVILAIQRAFMSTTGHTLLTNGNDHLKVIAELEKISKNHKATFWEQYDKLETTLEHEKNATEINLQTETIPSLTSVDLSEGIHSAFAMFHQIKEFQRIQFVQNPMPRNPPVFPGLPFRPHYNNNNTIIPAYPPIYFPNMPPPQLPPPPPPPPPVTQFSSLPMQIELVVPTRSVQTPQQKEMPRSVSSSSSSSSSPQRPNVVAATAAHPSSSSSSIAVIDEPAKVKNPHVSTTPQIGQSQDRQKFKEPSNNNNNSATNNENVRVTENANVHDSKQQYPKQYLSREPSPQSSRRSSVPSTLSSENSQDHFDTRTEENHLVANEATRESPGRIHETAKNYTCSVQSKETKRPQKNGHSMDTLMRIMRSHYPRVVEYDLVKSVECVRKKHQNSLTGIPIREIIREAERDIMNRQQKQLCGYEKRTCQMYAVPNSSSHSGLDGEREPETCTTSSANSAKKEHSSLLASKKKWEPVVIPNDTWNKEALESECAICYETMLGQAQTYTLQCKHTFHKTCIKHWYETSQTCPTCRIHSTIDDEYPPLPLG